MADCSGTNDHDAGACISKLVFFTFLFKLLVKSFGEVVIYPVFVCFMYPAVHRHCFDIAIQ